ncbi:DgyrCDS5447 [Dimorphilus gyrociliatus]|uniref:DgyrCDS5447 n=1 Tax=Dimorphilus gyrociliatus TaxID=2664684 RepID=A0A7I8VJX5_9ANNE|nr:DgyrCDS5447 [Dimorphilus gyrociliatus]
MAAPIQIYKKTICCSICGFQKKKISKGQEFCENCQPDRCEQLMLIKDYSLWLQENLMNEMNENRKKLRRNRERLFTDDEIDFILEYIDKEEKSTFEFILENEKARFKRDFNRQIKELQCKVESFFLEKRATLKIFQDDEQTENANYKKDISLLNNSKWIIEKKLSIILRHITYQPRQYALGNLSITGKSVQFVGLQQKDMKNCKAVRGLCVFNEKIFMIKWSNFNPTVSIVSVYDLKGNFIQNLSKTSNEFTAIDVTNDGKFYIADMTNNCVLESVDCTDFKPLFNIDHPQGISIGSDGIFIACDDPQTSRKHLINMYKFSFDGQLLYHFEDSYKSLFKIQ